MHAFLRVHTWVAELPKNGQLTIYSIRNDTPSFFKVMCTGRPSLYIIILHDGIKCCCRSSITVQSAAYLPASISIYILYICIFFFLSRLYCFAGNNAIFVLTCNFWIFSYQKAHQRPEWNRLTSVSI